MTKRKSFTPAFKLETAKLMVEKTTPSNKPVKRQGPVKCWRQQYWAELAGKALPNTQALTSEQWEIQELKQRIRQLGTEKGILKKASAFFAKEMGWATVSLTG